MAEIVKAEILLFLLILGIILVFRALNGSINMRGLVDDDRTRTLSGGRLQLLVATLVAASAYFLSIVTAPSGTLPDVPGILLLLVGGSNIGYLGSKIYSHLWKSKKP